MICGIKQGMNKGLTLKWVQLVHLRVPKPSSWYKKHGKREAGCVYKIVTWLHRGWDLWKQSAIRSTRPTWTTTLDCGWPAILQTKYVSRPKQHFLKYCIHSYWFFCFWTRQNLDSKCILKNTFYLKSNVLYKNAFP